MDSPRLPSPSRYNPKVEERKMRAETDWAKLVRHQQALAEKMIQQERDMRMLQRMELKDSLTNMATEKKNTQTREYQQAKQEAFVEIKEREKDFNEYHNKLKNDKNEFQKLISDEYSREKWMREEEQRRRMEQEKRMDQQTIKNALDSLEKEKMLKERQKSEFIQGVDQLMRERELQRMREKEQAQLNRQEHNELVNQAIQNVDMKDLNYKLYYQKLMEKQYNRQQIHDQRVHQSVLNKEKQIESFVEQNVREEQRRKEEEERRRQQFRQQQLQDVTHNIKTKIYEHQEEKFREKASYQEKVDELMRQNQESQNLNNELKMLKNIQALDYKNTLAYQMKEQQEVKRKFDSDMSEHEKAMHLNNFGARLIPGVKNTMNDLLNFPTIKSKTVERMKVDAVTSPYGSPSKAGKSFMLPNDADSPTRGAVGNISMYSPTSPNGFNKTDAYNPITNPLPNFNQNPYIQKEPKNDSPQRRLRNILATTAEANLGNGGRIGF